MYAWFEKAWADAVATPDLGGYALRYRQELPPEIGSERLRELAAQIEGKPDHPERPLVERTQRRLRDGPDVDKRTAWCDGERWRWATEPLYVEHSRLDRASGDRFVWSLTEEELVIGESSGRLPAGRDPRISVGQITQDLRWLLWGGLNPGPRVGFHPVTVRPLGEGTWLGLAEGDGGRRDEYVIRWDTQAHRGFVERVQRTGVAEGFDHLLGEEVVFADWQFVRGPDRWVAGRAEQRAPDGRTIQALVFERFEPVSDAEFEQLLAVPAIDGSDPERGPITVKRVFDYRPGEMVETLYGGEVPLKRALTEAESRPTRSLRLLGWVTAGGLLGTFILLRWKRSTRP